MNMKIYLEMFFILLVIIFVLLLIQLFEGINQYLIVNNPKFKISTKT